MRAKLRALFVLLVAGTAQWFVWQAGSNAVLRAVDTVRDPVRRSDTSLTGQLVVDMAMALVLVAGTWLVLATVATVVTETGPVCVRRRCPILVPKAWRRLVIGLLGTGVLAFPVVVSGAATAAGRGEASDDVPPIAGSSLHLLDGLPYPDRPTAARVTAAPPTPPAPDPVVVRPGDSLWSLMAAADPGATDAQIAVRWPRWYAGNRQLIGSDPDLLMPGTVLDPPRQP